MTREHRKITTEFKGEAVRRIPDQRLSLTEVSRKPGNRIERGRPPGTSIRSRRNVRPGIATSP